MKSQENWFFLKGNIDQNDFGGRKAVFLRDAKTSLRRKIKCATRDIAPT
jgi:hypothetical protein